MLSTFTHSIHINKEHYVYFFKLPANIIHNIFKISLFFNRIVKPVLQGHLWYKEKLALKDRRSLKGDSIHMTRNGDL